MQQNPMMRIRNILSRNVFHQIIFYFSGRICRFRHQPHTMTHTVNMRIHRHRSMTKPYGTNHIRRLAPHSCQLLQIIRSLRHLTSEHLNQLARHFSQMLRLGIRITHRTDQLINIFLARLCHVLRIRITGKESRRNHVDAFVGALRRKQGSHQKLKCATELQLGSYIRQRTSEMIQYKIVSFLTKHFSYFLAGAASSFFSFPL